MVCGGALSGVAWCPPSSPARPQVPSCGSCARALRPGCPHALQCPLASVALHAHAQAASPAHLAAVLGQALLPAVKQQLKCGDGTRKQVVPAAGAGTQGARGASHAGCMHARAHRRTLRQLTAAPNAGTTHLQHPFVLLQRCKVNEWIDGWCCRRPSRKPLPLTCTCPGRRCRSGSRTARCAGLQAPGWMGGCVGSGGGGVWWGWGGVGDWEAGDGGSKSATAGWTLYDEASP